MAFSQSFGTHGIEAMRKLVDDPIEPVLGGHIRPRVAS